MSRIGKLPIALPKGVEVSVSPENVLTVKGPLGTLTQQVNPAITMNIEDGHLHFTRPSDSKEHKAMHGLYRALAANMVKGVSEGFKTVQEVIGTRARMELEKFLDTKVFLELKVKVKDNWMDNESLLKNFGYKDE